jgi:hypothetical protein
MMKKILSTMLILIALLCSQLLILADNPSETTPHIRLPTEYVTMNAKYGKNAWFDIKLFNVPYGFDINNRNYNGWCLQKDISMTKNVNHAVMLYSSFDQKIPDEYKDIDWDKINYIINHKIGDRESIQKAIWYITDLDSYPSDNNAQQMIAEADLFGEDYIPISGELIAIIVDGIQTIQKTFIELEILEPATLGDFIWNDIDYDGIQDIGEPGLSNIEVRLLDENNNIVDITHTDNAGYYRFNYVDTNKYYIQFILPDSYSFSPKHAGTDNKIDSDADIVNGKTDLITVNLHISNNSIDAGIYKINEEKSKFKRRNHAPTADATAGEPYNGFTDEEITFNGSLSYDRDGFIKNWSWDFGDGTKGYGEIVNHIYSKEGKYIVILTVKDNRNAIDKYSTYSNILLGNYPPSEPIVTGPIFGNKNTNYSFTVIASDPDNDKIKYFIDWGDGETSSSEFLPSNNIFSTIKSWSEAGKYIIIAKANDDLAVSISEKTIYIDAIVIKDIGYFTDDNNDGIYDLFHKNLSDLITKLKPQSNDNYLIDLNGDGEFDYEYNPETDELTDYKPSWINPNNLILLIISIIGILLLPFMIIKRKKDNK